MTLPNSLSGGQDLHDVEEDGKFFKCKRCGKRATKKSKLNLTTCVGASD